MKNLLPILFCSFSFCSFAQVNTVMPQEANSFYNRAMHEIKPQVKSIIEKNAIALRGRTVNVDSLSKQIAKEKVLKGATRQDVEAIAVLIMVQISLNADSDLKNMVINMRNNDNENKADRKSTQDRVDRIMAHKSEIAENVSLVMKRISGAQDIVINNLR
ncbi:MAG TPA: hypothetical protein VFI29_15925 [Hanamia sp.]|nr:hypothetical protein [Hanamia sp.]